MLEIETIEVHAEGEPGRIITSAAHLVRGDTMAERFAYCGAELDGLRRLILTEPRGYPALCAVLILPAVNPGSAFGIVVLEQGGFTPMSGSNTICAVTAMLESGRVPMVEPQTRVRIDTAIGVVEAVATVRDGRVQAVTVVNVPAFVVGLDLPLEVAGFGTVPVDLVFGGQFFVQARIADLGLDLDPDRGRELARAGALLKLAAREQLTVRHPANPAIDHVNLVMMHTGDRRPGEQDRNVVVLTNGPLRADDPSTWTGALDRSPVRDRDLGADGGAARPRPARDRREVQPPQHHRQRVHRRADRYDHGRAVSGRAAHHHRERLGHRLQPMGAGTTPTRSRPATPSATSGPRRARRSHRRILVASAPRRPKGDHEPVHRRPALPSAVRPGRRRARPQQRRGGRRDHPGRARRCRPCGPGRPGRLPGLVEPPRPTARPLWSRSPGCSTTGPRSSPSSRAGSPASRSG